MAKGELNIEKKGNIYHVYINPKLTPIDVVYTAAYVFLDKAYIVLDGNIKKEIIVKIMPKDGSNGRTMALEFNNELIKYNEYKLNLEKNKELRQIILQRAMLTNDPGLMETPINDDIDAETKKLLDEIENEDGDFLDDPEGIAIPWEEKYGNKGRKSGKTNNHLSKKVKKKAAK